MAWVCLIIAGIFEWGWPVGLKFAWKDGHVVFWPALAALVCILASSALLVVAQRSIPMGTAYAVWTGIGAFGTFVIGLMFFGEPSNFARFFFVALIIVGIVGLKFASSPASSTG